MQLLNDELEGMLTWLSLGRAVRLLQQCLETLHSVQQVALCVSSILLANSAALYRQKVMLDW